MGIMLNEIAKFLNTHTALFDDVSQCPWAHVMGVKRDNQQDISFCVHAMAPSLS